MTKLIIIVVLLTIIVMGLIIGFIWALITGEWLWAINFSAFLINVLMFALISVPALIKKNNGTLS